MAWPRNYYIHDCIVFLRFIMEYFAYIISDPFFLSGSIFYFIFCKLRLVRLAQLTHAGTMYVWRWIYRVTSSIIYYKDQRTVEWACKDALEIMNHHIVMFFMDPLLFIAFCIFFAMCILRFVF